LENYNFNRIQDEYEEEIPDLIKDYDYEKDENSDLINISN
jgi:hypothetical protein